MEGLVGLGSWMVSCLNVQARKITARFSIMKLTWALPLSGNPQLGRHFFQVELQINSIHQIKVLRLHAHKGGCEVGQACIKKRLGDWPA
jgi:hypothetical protein